MEIVFSQTEVTSLMLTHYILSSYIVLLHGRSMKAYINFKISILRLITIEYILSYLFFYTFMPVAI